MGDGFDQRFVFAPARAGDGAGGGVESLADDMAALGDVDDDFGGAQGLGVVVGRGDDDRRRRRAGCDGRGWCCRR